MSKYTIDQGLQVADRMNLLALVQEPTTLGLLDELNVRPGWTCVDLGSGGGHVTMELGRRVGPRGRAVGIDLDEELIELARANAAAKGLSNVSFQVGAAEELSGPISIWPTRGCSSCTCAGRFA